jgi:3-phosphoinositide dependent protein kinase-1
MTAVEVTADLAGRSLPELDMNKSTTRDMSSPSPVENIPRPLLSRHISPSSSSSSENPPQSISERSRHDPTFTQVSVRSKLPEAADPEYSYVYVPSLNSLPSSSTTTLSKPELERPPPGSGRTSRASHLDPSQYVPSRPRSGSNMSENPSLNRYSSQDRMGSGRRTKRQEEWAERGAAVVTREVPDRNGGTTTRVIKRGVKDFDYGDILGEGSYSTVMMATDRSTLKDYAIKMLDKKHIVKEKKAKYVNIEKNTLNRLGDHPGIVRLYYTFQDESTLYFVLDLAANGELLGFLKKVPLPCHYLSSQLGTFNEECTKYYSAMILDALEYMHNNGVIHRDLKPEKYSIPPGY